MIMLSLSISFNCSFNLFIAVLLTIDNFMFEYITSIVANIIPIKNYYKEKDESLKNKAIEIFEKVETFLRNKDNRSNDMEFDDLMVGHSYFMAETLGELKLKWEYEVSPLLKEYQKDGLLRHSIDIEKDLNVVIQETEV